MKLVIRWTLFLLVVMAVVRPAQSDDTLAYFFGEAHCRACHDGTGAGRRCAIPDVPEHRDALAALQTDDAREITALSGVPEPPESSSICLGCHATGAEVGPRWWANSFHPAAGVQCEACHGAGSGHASQPKGGHLRRIDRSVCTTCHRALPSHDWVLHEGFRRAAADRRYRTPENLAVSPDGNKLYVACSQSDSVLAVNLATRQVVAEVAVGRRPQDVAISADGKRLFVTNRHSDTMSVIDTDRMQMIATVAVGDDPHGVLSDRAEKNLFVLNTGDDSISVIDLAALAEVRRLPAGRGPWSLTRTPVGTIAVTSVRPQPARFQQPHASELTLLDAATGRISARRAVPDANMLKGIASVDAGPHRGAVLFTLMRTKNLVPATRLLQGWVITNGLGVMWPSGQIDQVLLDDPVDGFADPNDVAVSPAGRHAIVTSGGSDRVAIIDVDALVALLEDTPAGARETILPNRLGVRGRFVRKLLPVGANPRGVVFAPDGREAYVANALDDSITVIDCGTWSVTDTIALADELMISELRRGARLFHSADITFGGQFSCQSCHPDGHINGLTIDIEADGVGLRPVDNRTLRGILDTAPFKWEGTNPSLARQCGPRLAVFFTRREPYTPEELQALVRYECTIERPPNRYHKREGLTPAQYRGKLVFERAFANDGRRLQRRERCITCHHGPYKTAQQRAIVRTTMWFDSWANLPLAGESMFDAKAYGDLGIFYFADTGVPAHDLDAPHLNNIYDSAPYLHNGAAATLEEIWTRYNYVEGHGYTRDLTRRQLNDLIAYLRTL